ncbi:hypothetical protein R1flu_002958 [Riccia fluitans]|uniref:Uncharacterized protein n=1 Tax=Riccia fluitans TaxID=41844 RepID=A0ABD1Y7M0_9MARC
MTTSETNLVMWSYHGYTSISHWNSDVKRLFARIIQGWVTSWARRPEGTTVVGHGALSAAALWAERAGGVDGRPAAGSYHPMGGHRPKTPFKAF